ncbi:MAG: hypothetical protein EZS28_034498 [Streblomastix strix]|uniref:Uncharacterized protein n=1 Tax=Streblomastix strix TaxID=222440 RepID=A0A5J4UJY2_9EUKA|nr:MAG: hypothetical protein EZS28_034498 [Streblomastix strix]
MKYPGPLWRVTDQSNTKLRSRQPTNRRQQIVPPTQTNPQSQITPYSNQNQRSFLNKKTAQVQHAPRETFSTNGNIRKVASSTDSIVSGQVGVAGTKTTNIQNTFSTQPQRNCIREPDVEKKGGRTPVRGKATSTNTSVVANQNQIEDQQR